MGWGRREVLHIASLWCNHFFLFSMGFTQSNVHHQVYNLIFLMQHMKGGKKNCLCPGAGNLFACCNPNNLRGRPPTFFILHALGGAILFITDGIIVRANKTCIYPLVIQSDTGSRFLKVQCVNCGLIYAFYIGLVKT